jgi:hypothetical protein
MSAFFASISAKLIDLTPWQRRRLKGYDEPEILRYSRGSNCLRGADVGHILLVLLFSDIFMKTGV